MSGLRYTKQVGTDDYLVTFEDEDGVAALGKVVRGRRSTDSTVGGSGRRRRRPGKGATVWRAEVPHELADGNRAQLQGCLGGGYRLEWRGQAWDRRGDAGEALLAWHAEEALAG